MLDRSSHCEGNPLWPTSSSWVLGSPATPPHSTCPGSLGAAARQEAHRDGRLAELEVELDPVQHLGRGREDGQGGRRLPAGAGLRRARASSSARPRPWRSDPTATPTTARGASTSSTPARARPATHGAAPLRLPHQRHRPEAELRRHAGPRPGRPHRLGLHRRPRRRGRRQAAARSIERLQAGRASRRWSSAWVTAPAPARARRSSTSSTSTTSCARPACATSPGSST